MKPLLTLFLSLILFSNPAFSSGIELDIHIISEKMSGSYFSSALPKPYSDVNLPESEYPVFSEDLKNALLDLEKKSLEDWGDYVEGQWQSTLEGEYSEFDFKDERTKNEIKKNPHPYLGLALDLPLNQIENISVLFKNYEPIGYVIELTNIVRSSLIEDGSGYVIYLDQDLKVILMTDWDA